MLRPRVAPEGRMSLSDHIRELRSRLIKAALGLAVGAIVGFVFFNRIWAVLREPFCKAHSTGPLSVNGCGSLVFGSVFDPILWHFKVALITGIVLSFAGVAVPDLGVRDSWPARPRSVDTRSVSWPRRCRCSSPAPPSPTSS